MDIAEHLKAFESELLLNTTRKNAVRVTSLLADDFREFGSSGRTYSEGDIVGTLLEESPVSISPSNFIVKLLSKQLARYVSVSKRAARRCPEPSATEFNLGTR